MHSKGRRMRKKAARAALTAALVLGMVAMDLPLGAGFAVQAEEAEQEASQTTHSGEISEISNDEGNPDAGGQDGEILPISVLEDGSLQAMEVGGTFTYDFKTTQKIFGKDKDAVGKNEAVYSENGYVKLESSQTLSLNGDHGLMLTDGGSTVFSMLVPANSQGQFAFPICKYNGSYTATLSVDGAPQGDSVSLQGGGSDCTKQTVFQYRNAGADPVTMTITIERVSGQCYIHNINYSVSEIPQEVTVSGNVGTQVAGDDLVFTNKSGVASRCTIEPDGTYQIELSIGSTYTVTLENDTNGWKLVDASLDLTSASAGGSVTQDFSSALACWNTAKSFEVTIGGTTFTVKPGATEADDFTVEAAGGKGFVEFATPETALIWADLQGGGNGALSADKVSSGDNVTTDINGNTLTVTYKDGETLPASYTLQVKDNSATGTPYATGETLTYRFTDGSVISTLYTGESHYYLTGGNSVTSADKLVTLTGNTKIYFNGTTHGIVLGNGDTIQIKVAGNAQITFEGCAYGNGSTITASSSTGSIDTEPQNFVFGEGNDGKALTYQYTGDEATLTFTIQNSGQTYLHGITVTNEAETTKTHPEKATCTPEPDLVGNASNLKVTPAGHSLNLEQEGGSIGTGFGGSENSFYLFPKTADYNVLEMDVTIHSTVSGNANGIWVGAFDENQHMMALATRSGEGLTQYYSKSKENGTSSSVSGTIPIGTTAHYKMYKNSEDSKFYIEVSYADKGVTVTKTAAFQSKKADYKLLENGIDTSVYYGIAVINAKVTVTNLRYTSADGATVYFDQNTYYDPIGAAPTVTGISAEVAPTREYINVTWTGDACVGDGKYVLEVSRDGKSWTLAAKNLTAQTYSYPVSSEEGGSYYFRVAGVLGMNVLPGAGAAYVTMADPVSMVAALRRPVVSADSGASSITLTWDAVPEALSYQIYRYSFDEGEENARLIATVSSVSYTDTEVEREMPYYYYVTAHSADNWSNPSNTVWGFASEGHSGEFVYEEESAGITVTKKSYDTVFTDRITIEGILEKAGSVTLLVNGAEAASQTVGARETFSFRDVQIQEGRNDVSLIAVDADGNQSRQTFNFVYLTNYDLVVDASYTGTDGDAVNGIPTYRTVQAAVDSVSSSNSSRVVILVKEGSYREHLQVKSPNISLIGEDSEKTVIHFFDPAESPAGGDMGARCAVYVQKTATNFSAENLTFENDYEYKGDGSISNESADALRNDAENTIYVNVRFLGYQDTLCANAGKQYYYKCYILGNVDFIYGNDPRAYFNDCQMVFRSAPAKNSGYVVAPKTEEGAPYGLTFYNCQVLSEDGCSGSGYLLARPWGPYAYVTWIDCYLGKILKPNTGLPYADMSGNEWENAYFYEFGSYGPGFAVNANRRQISEKMAQEMRTSDYLGWDPAAETSSLGGSYLGSVVTSVPEKFVEKDYHPDTYLETDGDDTGLGRYRQEGYAQSAGVTGGGLLYETSDNYYTAAGAEEFLQALTAVKKSGMPSVIELTADIDLGSKEVPNFADYSSVISAHKHQPLIHPTLLQTGMSTLSLRDMGNLTIFSSNGSSIKHACIDIYNSTNIIIRNIAFDECWEWDEFTEGAYDENDWDYMTIEKGSADIWIDHCTFYKAYDGVIDAKTPVASSNITISWCEFLPGSEGNVFFDEMMNELKANAQRYPYYQSLKDSGMSEEQIYGYAYGQKKTHLFGQSVDAVDAVNLTVTLANNHYLDSMDRMPRLRYGTAHVYNCVLDAQHLREIRNSIANAEEAKKIVSNGASSTCGAHVLLENSVILGITNALNSGNGDDPAGYINAVNTLYYMDGVRYKLEPKVNTTYPGAEVLLQDADAFLSALPYTDYVRYDPAALETEVVPYAGAGKLTLTALQWEKTAYHDAQWTPPAEVPDHDADSVPDYTETPEGGDPADKDPDASEDRPGSEDDADADEDLDENGGENGGEDSDEEDDAAAQRQEEALEKERQEQAKTGKTESLVKSTSGKTQRRLTNSHTPGISIAGSVNAIAQGSYFTAEYRGDGKHYKDARTAAENYLSECEEFRVIDISLYNVDDVAIHQLKEMVSVTLRIPDDFTVAPENVIVVYRLNEDGSLTRCSTSVSGSYLTFQTNHFSTFVIAEQTKAGAAKFVNRAKAPGTGEKVSVALAASLGLILAGLAALEVFLRRRREAGQDGNIRKGL